MHQQQLMNRTLIRCKAVFSLHQSFKILAHQLLNNYHFSVCLFSNLHAMLDKISALLKEMQSMEYALFREDFV
jgi:hypothetical protein